MSRARQGAAAGALAVVALVAAACGSSTAGPVAATPPRAPTGSAPSAPALPVTGAWPEAMRDARHSGASSAVGPQAARIVWKRNLGAAVSSGPAVGADGTIYVSSNAGVLHALDPSTGADLWTYPGGASGDNGEDLSTSAAVLPDGTVLWPGPNSTLDALSPGGRLLWSTRLRGTVLSPALGADGRVYVSDSDGDIESLRPSVTAAHVQWSVNIGKVSFGSVAVGADATVYGTADDDLVAITDHGSRASIRWRFAAGAAVEVSPSVGADGVVVLGTNDGYEYGIDPAGREVWRYPLQVYSYSTPVVTAGGLAYFGDNDGYVDVVAVADGKVVGRYDGAAKPISGVGDGVWTAPLVDGRGDVYFGTAAGHVFGFSYTGAELFDIDTGATVDSYPALTATGALVIGSDSGTVYDIRS
jgi:outer membrane protein assembly factor BamB